MNSIDSVVGVGDVAAAADFRLIVSCSFSSCDTDTDKAGPEIHLAIAKLRKGVVGLEESCDGMHQSESRYVV